MDNIRMNNESIFSIHNKLNDLYSLAENLYVLLKTDTDWEITYGFFAGHYIKIGDTQEYQKYPLPVISVAGKGDIGVNLNNIWLEFFLDRKDIKRADLSGLLCAYNVEIYGGTNCLLDFYYKDKSAEQVIGDINASIEQTIGFAVYLDDFQLNLIKDTFVSVCNLLVI